MNFPAKQSGEIHIDNFLSENDKAKIRNTSDLPALKTVFSIEETVPDHSNNFLISFCKQYKRRGLKSIDVVNLKEYLGKIKNGQWKDLIEPCRRLYAESLLNENKTPYNKKKGQLPVLTFSGIFEGELKFDNLKQYTQFVILDIDKDDDNEFIKRHSDINDLKTKLKEDHRIYAMWISPSRYGLKILVKGNQTQDQHKEFFKQLGMYFKEKYSITIDNRGNNISRLCYVSYDPELYLNTNAVLFEFSPPQKTIPGDLRESSRNNKEKINSIAKTKPGSSSKEILDSILSYLTSNNRSITYDYGDWINVGFALINEFYKEPATAKEYFHLFSKLDKEKYNSSDNEAIFNQLAQDNKHKVYFATIIYLAKAKGFVIDNSTFGEHLPCAVNIIRLTNYSNFFKTFEEIVLFEYFMIKAKSFLYKEFYYPAWKIESETKIKRTKKEKVIERFIELGILDTELKGIPRVTHFTVNFDKVIELASQIYKDKEDKEEEERY